MEFFADYGALISPIAAVINGFIAVLVANFLKDNAKAKVVLVVSAALLGIAGIGASILSQRQLLSVKIAEQTKNKARREALGSFIADGLKLIVDCSDSSIPPKLAEANKWFENVSLYLSANMGDAYVTRLKNPAGLPINAVCRMQTMHITRCIASSTL
jgi:ABC-type transport system involved in cytochrome bd biosynthesis fused ATPase/permease subunit